MKKKERKPIQLLLLPPGPRILDAKYNMLAALCDDGSIWISNLTDDSKEGWSLYEPIPQD